MSDMTTWREQLHVARQQAEDSSPWVHCTLSDEEMDQLFDAGFGGRRGKTFTAWTERRVYFPATYDGSEWAESVPRDPCDEATPHVGGG